MTKIACFVGDFYHAEAMIAKALEASAEGLDIELSFHKLVGLASVLSQKPRAILLSLENRLAPNDDTDLVWLTDELDIALEAYVKEGGRLFVLHSALASFDFDSRYIQMLRGGFKHHPEKHCIVRYFSDEGAAAFAGHDFSIDDEHYHVELLGNTNVFLHAESLEHGRFINGWYHDFGKGKVLCIAPTHTAEGYENPGLIKLLGEGLSFIK